MTKSKIIDQVFTFAQSYRRKDTFPSPDDFSMFSESFSISKINIESQKEIAISNMLVQPYFFRSKIPAQNPITLAFIMSDNIEFSLNDEIPKFVDFFKGEFPEIAITDFFESLPALDQIDDFPLIVAYQGIPEFDNLGNSNYLQHSARKLLLNEDIILRYIVQSGIISTPTIKYFNNTNLKKYLYAIAYVPKIQNSELAVSGRFSFTLEY
jgi:hypothetical protein